MSHPCCSNKFAINQPDICVGSLGSDPGAAKANLRGLVNISLVVSVSIAAENNASISAMLNNTIRPRSEAIIIELYGNNN